MQKIFDSEHVLPDCKKDSSQIREAVYESTQDPSASVSSDGRGVRVLC